MFFKLVQNSKGKFFGKTDFLKQSFLKVLTKSIFVSCLLFFVDQKIAKNAHNSVLFGMETANVKAYKTRYDLKSVKNAHNCGRFDMKMVKKYITLEKILLILGTNI